MKSIELFTGAGGLALGTHMAGFQHVALMEWNTDACDTLRENVTTESIPGIGHWNVLQGDIGKMAFEPFGPVDLVVGGVPCQPFSIGGKHRGMTDSRNMFPDFVRAVRELQPRAFIIENVKGLLRQSFRNYFSYIVLQLTYPTITIRKRETWEGHLARLENEQTRGRHKGIKYNVVFRLLNAADYGVPQTRERAFIVGFRSDSGQEWHFPEPTHDYDALLREQWITGAYWERHGLRKPREIPPQIRPKLGRIAPVDLFPIQPWVTVRDAISDLPEPRSDREPLGIFNHRLNPGGRAYPGHTGSPLDLPAKTLKAGDHGVPGGENMIALPDGGVRYFTVREAARIQTFPDGWRFRGVWGEAMRQLGNAVPVRLASIVARSVASKLGEADVKTLH